MRFFNRREVERLLDLDQLVEAVGEALAALSAGGVSMPARIAAHSGRGLLAAMPVFLPVGGDAGILAAKLVSVFPDNGRLGLPSHQAIVAVFDAVTGAPLALMDGAYITAVRTAAASALATRLLAPPESSTGDILLVIGAGVQARAHARAIPRVRRIREIRVAARHAGRAADLAEELERDLGLAVRPMALGEAAWDGAGIVCATTHAAEPVVRGAWLRPGMHINSVGLNHDGREVDAEAVCRSLVFVESRHAALAPAPAGANDLLWPLRDGLITAEHIQAELGELVSGVRHGRNAANAITLYKSVGVAAEDAVAARLVLAAAATAGFSAK